MLLAIFDDLSGVMSVDLKQRNVRRQHTILLSNEVVLFVGALGLISLPEVGHDNHRSAKVLRIRDFLVKGAAAPINKQEERLVFSHILNVDHILELL